MIEYGILLGSIAACVAADLYDITKTVAGIKKGVGVEGSAVINFFTRTNKPSFLQLLVVNMFVPIVPMALPGLILSHNVAVEAFSIVGMLIGVYTHVHGGLDWKALIGGANPNTIDTQWWEKIL
jgi:Flp pilus assembly pilin Flp